MKKIFFCLLLLAFCTFNVFAVFEFTSGLYIGGFSGPNFDPKLADTGYKPINFSFSHAGWNIQLGNMWGEGDDSKFSYALLADLGLIGWNASRNWGSYNGTGTAPNITYPDMPIEMIGGILNEFYFRWIGFGVGAGYGTDGIYFRGTVPIIFRYVKMGFHYDYFLQPGIWRAGLTLNLRNQAAAFLLEFLAAWFS